jgi:hypothetical protein
VDSRHTHQAGNAAGHGHATAGDVRASRPAAQPGPRQRGRGVGEEAIRRIVDLTRSFLPGILATGVATEEEVDLDTLAERLRADTGPVGRVMFWPTVVGAFATKPA